jgi:hypothetical protein
MNFLDYKAATLEICGELKVMNCFLTFNTYFLTHNNCQEMPFFFCSVIGFLKSLPIKMVSLEKS